MKPPPIQRLARSLLLGAACAAVTASAATVPRLDFARVVDSSERIVHGRVTRVWTAWDSTHRFIWTHAEVAVSENLKGEAGPLTLSAPGGALDGLSMPIAGAARFAVGDEIVAFAYPTGSGLWRLRGWGQGLYRVNRAGDGPRVEAQTAELRLVVQPEKESGGPAAAASATPEDLSGFLAAIRARVAEESAR